MAEVSVIVPVYQVEQYLRQCLDSILNQTFRDIEVILVDDGSMDNSGKTCDEYALKDNRVKVIHTSNIRAAGARNLGLDHMTGKYFMFVDSDDCISPNMIEKLYTKAKQTDSDIVCCNYRYFWEENREKDYCTEFKEETLNCSEIFYIRKNERNYGYWTVVWNKLYKTETIGKLRFRTGKYFEDEFFANDLYQMDMRINTVSDCLYDYRQHKNSTMQKKSAMKYFDLIEAFQERMQIYLDQNMYPDQAYKVLIYSLEPLNECRKLKKTEEDNTKFKQAVEKTKDLIRQLKLTEISGIQKYSLILIQMNPCLVFSMAMKCRGILERFI